MARLVTTCSKACLQLVVSLVSPPCVCARHNVTLKFSDRSYIRGRSDRTDKRKLNLCLMAVIWQHANRTFTMFAVLVL